MLAGEALKTAEGIFVSNVVLILFETHHAA